MLEERDQAGRGAIDAIWFGATSIRFTSLSVTTWEVAFVTRLDLIRVQEMAFIVERGIRLCDVTRPSSSSALR